MANASLQAVIHACLGVSIGFEKFPGVSAQKFPDE